MVKEGLEVTAEIVGWGYFLAWTVSFYPQIYENWRRKSVIGFSFDMLAYFLLSYVTYLVYNVTVYFDVDIQHELLKGSEDQSSPVKLTDVVFAIVAFLCTVIQGIQCLIYERGAQKIDRSTLVVCCSTFFAWAVLCVLAAFKIVTWLLVLTFCGYVKLVVSFGTYLPQIFLNYKRKSTEGFHIGGVLLDFSGGILSVLQMDLYCVIERSTAQLTGNIPKLALGIVTLLFNIVLVWQHYVFYIGNVPLQTAAGTETEPLLKSSTKPQHYSVNADDGVGGQGLAISLEHSGREEVRGEDDDDQRFANSVV